MIVGVCLCKKFCVVDLSLVLGRKWSISLGAAWHGTRELLCFLVGSWISEADLVTTTGLGKSLALRSASELDLDLIRAVSSWWISRFSEQNSFPSGMKRKLVEINRTGRPF